MHEGQLDRGLLFSEALARFSRYFFLDPPQTKIEANAKSRKGLTCQKLDGRRIKPHKSEGGEDLQRKLFLVKALSWISDPRLQRRSSRDLKTFFSRLHFCFAPSSPFALTRVFSFPLANSS